MSIIRIEKKERPFVQVDKECINQKNLSFKAKGLHTFLMSKPDDWTFYMTQLETVSTDGKDSLRSAMKELEDAGYVRRTRHRNKNGTWGEVQTIVRETAMIAGKSTQCGFSDVGLAVVGSPATTNNDSTKNEKSDNEYIRLGSLEAFCTEHANSLGWSAFRYNLFSLPKPDSQNPSLFRKKLLRLAVEKAYETWKARGSSMSTKQKIGMINELDQQLAAEGVVVI